jgi:hypothetical protein
MYKNVSPYSLILKEYITTLEGPGRKGNIRKYELSMNSKGVIVDDFTASL